MNISRLGGGLAGIALALASVQGAAGAEPALEISHRGGLMTLTISDVPLAEVLRTIGERMGVAVQLRGELATLVDAEFTDVPLDEAIKRLARGHSVCLLYGAPRHDGGVALTDAWVIESPPGGRTPARPEPARTTRVPDGRPTGGGAEAVTTLTRMLLDDKSATVRAQAAMELLRLRNTTATSALVAAARRDSSTNVRRLAVRGLAALRTDDARNAVEAAAYDEDAGVRSEATRALARWER